MTNCLSTWAKVVKITTVSRTALYCYSVNTVGKGSIHLFNREERVVEGLFIKSDFEKDRSAGLMTPDVL